MAQFGSQGISITSLLGGGGGISSGITAVPLYGGGRAPITSDVNTDAGELAVDLSSPYLGVPEILGSAGDFVGNMAGGALGLVGQVGIPGGPNIGDIPEALGEGLGAVGSISLGGTPLPTNPVLGGTLGGGGQANVGAIPGAMLDVVGLLERGVQRTLAGRRAEAAAKGEIDPISTAVGTFLGILRGPLGWGAAADSLTGKNSILPPDIQDRLDAGEINVDQAADELVARNAGYTNDEVSNLAGSILFDPLNLLSFGAAKAVRGVAAAGTAVTTMDRGGDAVNAATRIVGRTYNVTTHGLSRSQQVVVQKFIGPATSGVAHAYGPRNITRLSTAARRLSPEIGDRLDHALAVANRHFTYSTVARSMSDEAAAKALDAELFGSPDAVARLLQQRVREADPKALTRMTEDDARRFSASLEGLTPDEARQQTISKLATVLGVTDDDAIKVLGRTADDLKTQQIVHLAYWGRLADEVAKAKASVSTAELKRINGGADTIPEANVAASQAENVRVGVERGGTVESGGAVRAEPVVPRIRVRVRVPVAERDVITIDTKSGWGRQIEDVPIEDAPTGSRLRGMPDGEPDQITFDRLPNDAAQVVWYGPDGKAHGYAEMSNLGNLGHENISVYVDEEFRRQGVASRLYDEMERRGLPVRKVSGFVTTAEGRQFAERYAERRAVAAAAPEPAQLLAHERSMNDAALGEAVSRLRPTDVRDPRYAVYDSFLSNHLASLFRMWIGRMSDEQLAALADRIASEIDTPTIDAARRWFREHGDEIQAANDFNMTLARRAPAAADEAAAVADEAPAAATAPTDPTAVYDPLFDTNVPIEDAAVLATKSADETAGFGKPLTAEDIARLTPIAPDTLTWGKAFDLRNLNGEEFKRAAQSYDEFAKYRGDAWDETKARALLDAMIDGDYLPRTLVEARIPPDNPIPTALGTIRAEMNRFGYELGFGPKEGWRVLVDKDGEIIARSPFVAVSSDATPLTVRNPLGQYMDSLFRGINQTRIIMESRQRLVQRVAPLGVNAKEAERIHQYVLWRARDQRVAPRGLAMGFGKPTPISAMHEGVPVTIQRSLNTFDHAFLDVIGEQRFFDLIKKHDPTTLMMQAFEGNLNTVGITQKVSGKAKSVPVVGRAAAAVAEGIYPLTKFRYNPLFQAQELIESPFWNVLRGVRNETVDPGMQQLYDRLIELDEFQWLAGAEYSLNTMGGGLRRAYGDTVAGKIAANLPDVQGIKKNAQFAQVITEHPDEFRAAVQRTNPRAWEVMVKHYGTDDAAVITRKFIEERMRLSTGLREAMAVFDEAKEAATGVARATTGPTEADYAMETVWNAFRESARNRADVAFRTHYFSAKRSFLERSVNHPYLGLYPASYMWGKVLPEFSRFLLLRPFGVDAPLTGLAAMQKVQEAYVAELTTNEEFAAFVRDNEDALYLGQMLLPSIPTDVTARTPSWARRVGVAAASGNLDDPRDVGETAVRAASDATAYAFGPLSSLPRFTGAAFDVAESLDMARKSLEEQLSAAAAMYDGMFQQP